MTFLWTGYVLTWLAVALYAWRLESRRAAEEEHLRFLRDEEGAPEAGARPAGREEASPEFQP